MFKDCILHQLFTFSVAETTLIKCIYSQLHGRCAAKNGIASSKVYEDDLKIQHFSSTAPDTFPDFTGCDQFVLKNLS